MSALPSINKFLKDSKLISNVSSALSGVPYIGPIASVVGPFAKQHGYGDGGMMVHGEGEGGRVASRAELMRRIKKMS